MKIVKRTASIVASLIIILAIGGFVFVRNFDLNRYKSYIEDFAWQQTGRKLALNGDAKMGLSLIPTLVVNDVTFANPDWAKNSYMMKLEKLEVQLSLGALLHRRIDIKKFILIKPEVYLETAKDGRKSWEFANMKTGKANSEGAKTQATAKVNDARALAAIGFVAKEVRLEDGQVIYYDAKTGKTSDVAIKNLEIEAESGEPIKLSVEALYEKQPVKADFELSDVQTIMQDNSSNFVGTIKAFNVKSNLNGHATNLTGDIKYQTELEVHNPAGNFGVPETSLLARVDGDTNKADINVRSLNIATNLIAGSIKAAWNKAKPEVAADLRSDVFDVRSLSKNSMLSLHIPSLISEAKALEVVPAEKIPYNFLNMLNGVMNVKIGKLVLSDDMIFLDMIVNAKLNGGDLNITKFNTTVFGGKADITGNVNAAKQSLAAKINASGISVADLYKATANDNALQVLSGGILDVNADITARGATYRQWSETLNGSFTALVDKSKIKTGKLSWLTEGVWAELFKLLNIDTTKNNELDVDCAVVNTQFKNGKAEFNKGIAFSSDKLKLVSSGDINLVDDKINFTVSPMLNKLAQGNISQAIASFIRVKGKLQKPSIGIDTASAVSTVVGSVATGGIYLGTEMLMSGDVNLCNTALRGTKYVSRFSVEESMQNSTKEVYQNVSGNAKDAVREIGNTAKEMFKALKSNLRGELNKEVKGETNLEEDGTEASN